MEQCFLVFLSLCLSLCMAINIDVSKFKTEKCDNEGFIYTGRHARLRCFGIAQNPCEIIMPGGLVEVIHYFTTRPDEDMNSLEIGIPAYTMFRDRKIKYLKRTKVTDIERFGGKSVNENLPKNSSFVERFYFYPEDYGYEVGESGYIEILFLHYYDTGLETHCFKVKYQTREANNNAIMSYG